jgi:hypothetical protein
MTGWPARPANWGRPGQPFNGPDGQAVLDQIEFLSQGVPVGMVVKEVGTSRNSAGTGTTYTDDPHLQFEVDANEIIKLDLQVLVDAGTTGDMKERFLLPSGTIYGAHYQFSTTAPTALIDGVAEITGLQGTGAGARLYLRVAGTLFVGSTGGTVSWQWAQNASDAVNTTVAQGGTLEFCRIQ